MYLIKIPAHSGFNEMKNNWTNKQNSLNFEIANMLQRSSSVSFSFKHPWTFYNCSSITHKPTHAWKCSYTVIILQNDLFA